MNFFEGREIPDQERPPLPYATAELAPQAVTVRLIQNLPGTVVSYRFDSVEEARKVRDAITELLDSP